MQEIYLRPVNNQLRGNRDDARTLERLARSKVGYLLNSMRPGETFKTGSWSLSNGRRILAFAWNDNLGKRATVRLTGIGDHVETMAFFLFLEAGAYRYPGLFTEDPDTTLYLTDPVRNRDPNFAPNGNLEGIVTLDYAVVKLVGDIVGASYETDSSRADVRGDVKKAQYYCPPGVFPGKMRLFMQALYGTKREDYRYEQSGYTGSWPQFYFLEGFDKHYVGYRGLATYILYTGVGYHYRMISIRLTDDYVYVVNHEMVVYDENLIHAVFVIRNILSQNYPGQEGVATNHGKSIVEALLLSLLKIGPVINSAAIPTPTGQWRFGAPIGYGWHSNWDGSTASIVAMTSDGNSFCFAGQTIHAHFSIDNITEDDEEIGVTFELGSAVSAGNYNDLHVWVPGGGFFDTSYISTVFWKCGIADPENWTEIEDAPEYFDDLPIYGFYNSDNEWQEITISKTYEDLGTVNSGSGAPFHFCEPGTKEATVITQSEPATHKTHLVKQNGVVVSIGEAEVQQAHTSYQSSTLEQYNRAEHADSLSDNGFSRTCGSDTWAYVGGPFILEYDEARFAYDLTLYEPTYSYAKTCVVLPWRDCEAYFSGQNRVVVKHRHNRHWAPITEVDMHLGHSAFTYYNVWSAVDWGSYEKHELYWTGFDRRGYQTDNRGIWQALGEQNVDEFFYNAGSEESKFILQMKDKRIVVHDAAISTGGSNDVPGGWAGGGSFSPVEPATPHGEWGTDMDVFFDAPYGICSVGIRNWSVLPYVMKSAVFDSTILEGQSVNFEEFNDGGLTQMANFVGWA